MEVTKASLLEGFIGGSQEMTCVIPIYQRQYIWGKQQIEELKKDIESLLSSNTQSHFLGSIIYVTNTDNGYIENIIVDGQQRLTTFFLLLYAMYNTIDDEDQKNRIYDQFLVNKYTKIENSKFKLKPHVDRNEHYGYIIENNAEKINEALKSKNNNLISNYLNLKKFVEEKISEFSFEGLFNAIKNIQIVRIMLNKEDNAQQIFQSINSNGVSLINADLIRNYIMMILDSESQEDIYKNYWSVIETNVDEKHFDDFFRYYLAIKEYELIRKEDIFRTFKEKTLSHNANKEEIINLLKEIVSFSKLYCYFSYSEFDLHNDHERILHRIKELGAINTFIPLLMHSKHKADLNEITSNDYLKTLIILDKYIVRRKLAAWNINNISRLPSNVIKHIEDDINNDTKIEYNKIIEKELITRHFNSNSKQGVPSNEELRRKIISENYYHPWLREIFRTIEETKSNVIRELSSQNYDIEHLVPQAVTNNFDKYEDYYNAVFGDFKNGSEYIHNIGNLTLFYSDDNKEASDKLFKDKKELLEKTNLKINSIFSNKDIWTFEDIKERASQLANEIINIWKIDFTERQNITNNKYLHNLRNAGITDIYSPVVIKGLKYFLVDGISKKTCEEILIKKGLLIAKDRTDFDGWFIHSSRKLHSLDTQTKGSISEEDFERLFDL